MKERLSKRISIAALVVMVAMCLCGESAWGVQTPAENTMAASSNQAMSVTPAGISTGITDLKQDDAEKTVSLSKATVTVTSPQQMTYTGKALEPAVQVKLGNTLISAQNYTVSYSNNTNAGTARVTVTGKGSYTDSTTTSFKILPASISSTSIALSTTSYVYDGKTHKPGVTVKSSTNQLQAGRDYSLAYSSNAPKSAGSYKATVKGMGNYTGTVEKAFTITKASQTIKTSKAKYKKTYGASAFKLRAKSSADGKLTYKSSNKRVAKVSKSGKVKIKGAGSAKIKVSAKATANYKAAAKTVKVKVKRKSLKSAKVKLGRTSYAYNGKAHKPKVTVKVGGRKLKRGADYKVVYKRNVDAGTASVYVKGKGNYRGMKKATFTVVAPAPEPEPIVVEPEPVIVEPEPTIVEPEPEAPAIVETVYITRTGECYHLSWCSSLRRSSIPISLGDAISRGYRPCHICNP